MAVSLNPFLTYWALGYKRLVPIVPPGAEISPRSSLAKRINTHRDPRGKTPGVKGADGWHSFDWINYETTEHDLKRWSGMQAGVGIKTGLIDGVTLIAIDADTLDVEHAKTVRDVIDARLGRLPVRVGRHPKALYLAAVDGPYKYARVEFGNRDERGLLPNRVEVLSDGRQFVAHGIHPTTRQPYHWPRDIVELGQLPRFRPEQIDALMAELQRVLPKAAPLIREGSTAIVNQETLTGRYDHVAAAVAAIPNTSALYPTRESFIQFGYALKGALQSDPAAALELFHDWAARWQDGQNDPEFVDAEWRRMKPPYRLGASWLYEQAEQHGSGFSRADIWFDDLGEATPAELNPFEELEARRSREEIAPLRATPYAFPDASAIPPRQWLYGYHYIRKFVSATVAPSGVGKSSLEIVEALAMASGKPLLGVEPRGKFRVWLWNGEDPRDELERRVAAAMRHYGLTREDVGDRLFVDTGREQEIVLAVETRDGARLVAPVVRGVVAAIKLNSFDVLQVDPFVSSHRVSENDNNAIDVVAKQWARIADECNCAVELVHHVRKLNGAEITVEDSRGASALLAAARPARALSQMTKGEAARLGKEDMRRRLFRFGDGKNNLALPADERTEWFELVSVALGNGHGDGLDAVMRGDFVGVVARYGGSMGETLGGDARSSALTLIRNGAWRRDVRAGDSWVGHAIAQAMQLDVSDEGDKARVKAIVTDWIRDGTLKEVMRQDAKRMMKAFIEVTETAAEMSPRDSLDVFE